MDVNITVTMLCDCCLLVVAGEYWCKFKHNELHV